MPPLARCNESPLLREARPEVKRIARAIGLDLRGAIVVATIYIHGVDMSDTAAMLAELVRMLLAMLH